MTIIIPDDYHSKQALEERRILCIPEGKAAQQDIRALRIGILNIMPKAENYELNLLFPLGRSPLQIEPVWIRLHDHCYASSDHSHLDRVYVSFEEAVKEKHLDGLLISGAPVEQIPFEDVRYWSELEKILDYARKNIVSTVGICWGGLALAKALGIEKQTFESKLFGVFETQKLSSSHPITGEMDDVYWCPHSRHAGIPDSVLEQKEKEGLVNLLSHSQEAGYVIFESSDHRFLMHLGHMEYEAERLVEEYNRDVEAGLTSVQPPVNVNLQNPVNRWRAHNLEFFNQWVRYVYENTVY